MSDEEMFRESRGFRRDADDFNVSFSIDLGDLLQSTAAGLTTPQSPRVIVNQFNRHVNRNENENVNDAENNSHSERSQSDDTARSSDQTTATDETDSPTNMNATLENINSAVWRADILRLWEIGSNYFNGSGSIMVPFLFLLLVKFLMNSFFYWALVIGAIAVLQKLSSTLSLQISSKGRYNFFKLINIFSSAVLITAIIIMFIESFGYTDHLLNRLSLGPVSYESIETPVSTNSSPVISTNHLDGDADSKQPNLLASFWNCFLTDLVVRYIAVIVKSFMCIILGLRRVNLTMLRSGIQWVFEDIFKQLGPIFGIRPNNQNTNRACTNSSNHDSDVEASPLLPTAPMPQSNGNTPATLTANGLVARRVISQQFNPQTIETGTATQPTDGSINSSDHPTDHRYANEYLLKLRLCTLIDMVFFCYRGLLPIPVWYAYLGSGTAFPNRIFGSLYLMVKILDTVKKFSSLFRGLHHFIYRGLDFGHYSTPEEMRTHNVTDCPICFDKPQRPITLNCNHIFCEMCIVEWLEKEKTCPVCRSQVQFESDAFSSLKREVNAGREIWM